MIELLRTLPTTWAKMTETEQTRRAHAVADAVRMVVREEVAFLETQQRVTIECLFKEVAFKEKGLIVAKLGMEYADEETRLALTRAQGKEILIVVADAARYMGRRAPIAIDKQQPELPLPDAADAEKQVDADLDAILAGDDSDPPAGQIEDLTAEREASEADPFAAGKRSALRGFNETENPHPHPSIESAEWLRGHAEGETERLAAPKRRRRPRVNGPGEALPPAELGPGEATAE